MIVEINKNILKDTLCLKGANYETIVAMEECAELIQAVSKCLRYKCEGEYRENLIEEIADVLICIEMLKMTHGVWDLELQKCIDYKMNRQKQKNEEETIPLF